MLRLEIRGLVSVGSRSQLVLALWVIYNGCIPNELNPHSGIQQTCPLRRFLWLNPRMRLHLILDAPNRLDRSQLTKRRPMNQGSKYNPLYSHLRQQGAEEVTLTFAQIEALIGERLPFSARTQRAWWSNRKQGAVQAQAWMGAGYHVEELDLAQEQVTFRKPKQIYRVRREGRIVLWDAELIKALRRHMGLTQAEFARELGVRQPTISEWETSVYAPKRSTSKLLTMVAEQAGFPYVVGEEEVDKIED